MKAIIYPKIEHNLELFEFRIFKPIISEENSEQLYEQICGNSWSLTGAKIKILKLTGKSLNELGLGNNKC